MDYEEIASRLGVSKSSVSLWVRDLPTPSRLTYEECRKRSVAGTRRYWEAERPARDAARSAIRDAAAAEIGQLSEREILLIGAIAYWCEGTKSKPHRRHECVVFTNSAGYPRSQLAFRIHIHENADIEAAQQFWLNATGASPDQFRRPTLKRHNPKTVRRNVGAAYHGCLRIDVLRSGDLYRRIDGWIAGIAIATSGAR